MVKEFYVIVLFLWPLLSSSPYSASAQGQGENILASDSSSLKIGLKLVFNPEGIALNRELDEGILRKYNTLKRKARITYKTCKTLSPQIMMNLSLQTDLLLKKYRVLSLRTSFTDSVMSNVIRSEQLESNLSKDLTYDITFFQAYLNDTSEQTVSEVKTKLLQMAEENEYVKDEKVNSTKYAINKEVLIGLRNSHPASELLKTARLHSVIGPSYQMGTDSRAYMILISERHLNKEEPIDSTITYYKERFVKNKWTEFVDSLLNESEVGRIKLSDSYSSYEAGMTIFNSKSFFAIVGCDTIDQAMVKNLQVAYERFVLSPDSLEFKESLRRYVRIPNLMDVYKGEVKSEADRSLYSALHLILETVYRANILYERTIVDSVVAENEIIDYYNAQIDRFTDFGFCSYLIAYLDSNVRQLIDRSSQKLRSVFAKKEYTPETKIKQQGFVVKFETDVPIHKHSRFFDIYTRTKVGSLSEFVSGKSNSGGFIILLTARSNKAVASFHSVHDQLRSELLLIRRQQAEKDF